VFFWQFDLSPGERANVLVELTGMTTPAVTCFGYPRSLSKRFIALYVDLASSPTP
jgi:hypothetical protein